eukprot:TRINITY_DN2872_c0_g2_i1.p1 TRINITY_DN2872_c0_g2~~TRINITY_DN2872_c0_g2_i1.p1  ORF type:complete len:113 (-),score=37.46 TRINITY_DN2872_c0_g2_i1:193-531(-)
MDVSNPDSEVHIQVWDYDKYHFDDFMGHIVVPAFDLVDKGIVEDWYELKKRTSKDKIRGDIYVKFQLQERETDSNMDQTTTRAIDKRYKDIVDEEVYESLDKKRKKETRSHF